MIPSIEALQSSAGDLVKAFTAKRRRIATAESCTGGMIAAYLTDVAGSSVVFDRGFVTYSNAAKSQMIAVPSEAITTHGAVSEPVARHMAEGAIRFSEAHVAVAVTGIAGPGGGSPEKPVGRVHFALADGTATVHRVMAFGGIGRDAIRRSTVAIAFEMLSAWIEAQPQAPTP